MFNVKVNNHEVTTIDGFKFEDGELLWQAMGEEADELGISFTEDGLVDWCYLPDDNIEVLLKAAKEQGFIEDYDIEEV